jgi:hypothetical protein
MRNIDNDCKFLFSQLKECHSCISALNHKREKDHPIRKLFEGFSLCSGAFYHLCLYQHHYRDLEDNSKNENEESWDIFCKTIDFQDFLNRAFPPSPIIHLDFRSMCIADAAFRISSAGVLLCNIIQQIHLKKREITVMKWPYQGFFNESLTLPDWKRHTLIQDNDSRKCVKITNKNHTQLALLVSLRDEYGHSEFNEKYNCRDKIKTKYYRQKIVKAEFDILQKNLEIIQYLCQHYDQKMIDFEKIAKK